jgi:hypothetical protein
VKIQTIAVSAYRLRIIIGILLDFLVIFLCFDATNVMRFFNPPNLSVFFFDFFLGFAVYLYLNLNKEEGFELIATS